MTTARLSSFLVKVASRCNLDCDYCYVYHHADTNWRSMPKVFSESDYDSFVSRLVEYAEETRLERCVIIFHGGEPLLAGIDRLVSYVRKTRSALAHCTSVDFGLQTNGLLLTKSVVDALAAENIAVSLSLDGPQEVNDLHRTSRRGRSSFSKVVDALELLQSRPAVFSGVISVIDPRVPPNRYFEFFSQYRLPSLDFLLPDAHHDRPPLFRSEAPSIYKDWLLSAFDLWIDVYPGIRIRTFESLLDAIAGLPSGTDAFGYGDVTLITVETDGSYHDLDVLKIVSSEATKLMGSVRDTAINEIANSPGIQKHRNLLVKQGLSATCQECEVVDTCGGGSLPHRYGQSSFAHPSIYCEELKALIQHATQKLHQELKHSVPETLAPASFDIDFSQFEIAEVSHASTEMARLKDSAVETYKSEFERALALARTEVGTAFQSHYNSQDDAKQRLIASRPGTIAWQRAFREQNENKIMLDVDGNAVIADESYLTFLRGVEIRPFDATSCLLIDPWLRQPFGKSIEFEEGNIVSKGEVVLREALHLIAQWRPHVANEMALLCADIQFVRDPLAEPDRIVSFSDNAVPGALFVSIRQGTDMIDPFDLADSLIHEYRHQKLYLLERMVHFVEPTNQLVVSPWRRDLRPPSGLLHAVFVFVELRRFWTYVANEGPLRLSSRAKRQLSETNNRLSQAWATLEGCPMTASGRAMISALRNAAS